MGRLLPLLALLLGSACNSFEPASLVKSLRVLALRGEPAEVASGAVATIRSLVVDLDPNANGRTITYDWAMCTKRPDVGVDIDPDCFDADMGDFLIPLPSLDGGMTQLTMPMLTLANFDLPDTSGGFYIPIRLRVSAGSSMVTAFHRLRWQAGFVPPNNNPTLTGIDYIVTPSDGDLPDMGQVIDMQPLVDGTPTVVPAGGKVRLRALDAAGSQESYLTFVGNPTAIASDPSQLMTTTLTEQIRYIWYTSAGKVSPDVTGEARPDTLLDTTQYTDSLAPRNQIVDVWLVAVEERGGTDFLHRQLQLR